MELTKVAVLGPRGNVGTAVISELLLQPFKELHVTAITRPGVAYTPPTPPPNCLVKLTHTNADVSSFAALVRAFKDHDCVINAISGSAVQYEPSKLIIDAAIAAKVKFFFANEFVGQITSAQFRRMPESAVGGKFRIREYLEQAGKDGKINWASLNGGPFFDMWLMKGPAGFDVKNRKARIYGTGENKLLWTPLFLIARAVVNIVRLYPEPDVVNRAVYIAPIRDLTQNRILDGLITVILDMEREKREQARRDRYPFVHVSEEPVQDTEEVRKKVFEVEHVDVKKINENGLIALERGELAKAMRGLTISNQFYEGDSGNDFSELVTNRLVEIPEISVEEAIRDAFRRWGMDCEVIQGMWKVDPCEI